jgi:flagellar capping protein FliD
MFELGPQAVFDNLSHTFELLDEVASSPPGRYCLIKKGTEETSGILYRMSHPLGQYVLNQALNEAVFSGKVTFDISRHTGYRISQVEQLKGHSGYLTLYKYIISSFDSEEFLLFAGFLHDGSPLTAEQCQKLFECGGFADTGYQVPPGIKKKLKAEIDIYAGATLEGANQQNLVYIREEEERLDKWTKDMVLALEKELENVKLQIRETERRLRLAATTAEHAELNEKLSELNRKKRNMRARLEDNEEEIEERRRTLIDDIKRRSQAQCELMELFTVEWEVI